MNTIETTLKEHLEEMTGLAVYSAVPCGMNYEEDGRYTMPARLEWLQNHAIEALKLAEKQEEALKAAKEALSDLLEITSDHVEDATLERLAEEYLRHDAPTIPELRFTIRKAAYEALNQLNGK